MTITPLDAKSAKSPRPARVAKTIRRTAANEPGRGASAVLTEARAAGLFDGDKTQHVSFRAPKALIEAAMRESGVSTPTDLGVLALAMLAQPDPVAAFLKQTRGALGAGHELDY